MFHLMARRSDRFQYPPLLHPPSEEFVALLPCLRNPIIPISHVISPSSCLGKINASSRSYKYWGLEGLEALGARLRFASGRRGRWWNSLWILILAVEGEGTPCCNKVSFGGSYFIRGSACIASFCVFELEKPMKGVSWVCLYSKTWL
jgi:hypothetical protein